MLYSKTEYFITVSFPIDNVPHYPYWTGPQQQQHRGSPDLRRRKDIGILARPWLIGVAVVDDDSLETNSFTRNKRTDGFVFARDGCDLAKSTLCLPKEVPNNVDDGPAGALRSWSLGLGVTNSLFFISIYICQII